jgi:hypothetical protein
VRRKGMSDAMMTGWGSIYYMCVVAFIGRRDSAGAFVWMIGVGSTLLGLGIGRVYAAELGAYRADLAPLRGGAFMRLNWVCMTSGCWARLCG